MSYDEIVRLLDKYSTKHPDEIWSSETERKKDGTFYFYFKRDLIL